MDKDKEREESTRNFKLRFGGQFIKGRSLQQIACGNKSNIGWIVWALETIDPGPTRERMEEFVKYPDIAERIERYKEKKLRIKGKNK